MSEFISKVKKVFRKLTLIIIGLFVLIMLFFYYANYSSGYRAGVPTKISHKGVVFKTYEGTLNVGGLTNTNDGTIPTTWDFSVRSFFKAKSGRRSGENRRSRILFMPSCWRG